MLFINTQIARGSGTLPKEISKDALVYLDASANVGRAFEWETISKPETSNAVFSSPILATTKFGPLDAYGVYLVKLWINRNQHDQKTKTLALNVPETVSGNVPTTPAFKAGSIIRNRDFDTGGPLPGYAAWWTIEDDAGLLNSVHAGVSRGRCIPQNYDSDGAYVMVLGDDLGTDSPMDVGDVFSVSQEIDLTNINTLTVNLKFIKR